MVFGNATSISMSHKKFRRDILKWDSDTSIGCAVHRMLKIFAGFKWQGYRYEERLDNLMMVQPPIIKRILTDDVNGYGGGIGLGLTIPLGAEFYLMMSVSGLALWSYEKIDINRNKSFFIDIIGIRPLLTWDQRGKYFSYGGSASLSFAYNIKKINTTMSIGGRYQLLFNRQRYDNIFYNDVAMNIIDKQYDHFFGVTMSVLHTFHIGKKIVEPDQARK